MNAKLNKAFTDRGLELRLEEIAKFYQADKGINAKDCFSTNFELEQANYFWIMMSDIETGKKDLIVRLGWINDFSKFSYWERMGAGYESRINEINEKSKFDVAAIFMKDEWKNEFTLTKREWINSGMHHADYWLDLAIGIGRNPNWISFVDETKTGIYTVKDKVLEERLRYYLKVLTKDKVIPILESRRG